MAAGVETPADVVADADPDPLRAAMKLRMPVIRRSEGPRARVDALEDYLLVTAFHQGELSEERHELYDRLEAKQLKWDMLDGWQAMARGKTETAAQDAKARLQPELYVEIQRLKSRIRRLSDEIERLERDATKASRAYTLIAGPS